MKKLSPNGKRMALVFAVSGLLLLICCLLLFGHPFAAVATYLADKPAVTFKVWNLTGYDVEWHGLLLDGEGQPVSDEYLPALSELTAFVYGTGVSPARFELGRPLLVGTYTLRVTFQFQAWGRLQETISELKFTVR